MILDRVHAARERTLDLLVDELSPSMPRDEFASQVFFPNTLQLRDVGNRLLSALVKSWELDFNIPLSGEVRLALDAKMRWPYFVSGRKPVWPAPINQKITLYNQTEAAMLRLCGDPKTFLGLDS
jgi:hypothetical protein